MLSFGITSDYFSKLLQKNTTVTLQRKNCIGLVCVSEIVAVWLQCPKFDSGWDWCGYKTDRQNQSKRWDTRKSKATQTDRLTVLSMSSRFRYYFETGRIVLERNDTSALIVQRVPRVGHFPLLL